jgi:predicted metal-dependent hydrolase
MVRIDRIIHSQRKTFALVIEPDGSVTVRAPLRASRAQIEYLVTEKAEWIQEKQAWLQRHPDAPKQKKFSPGERFYYLGNTYPLEIVPVRRPQIQLCDGRFQLSQGALTRALQVFTNWYRTQARQVISELVGMRAKEHEWIYKSIHITSAKRRWGSCGANGTLNFSWRLVMAPVEVIDYVVIHELVHLEIKNHSHRFWEQLASIEPDYKSQIAWLKTNGRWLHQ